MLKIYIKPKLLSETKGDRGLQYELQVHDAMVKAGIPELNPGEKPVGGFNRHSKGDIEATLKEKPFLIEVKLSKKDQMGAGQVVYTRETGEVFPHPNLLEKTEPDDLEMMLDAAKKKIPSVEKYLNRLDELLGTKTKGLPVDIPKEAREQLKNEGLLLDTNTAVVGTAKYIVQHYNKKGVYYIQIGGAGLFYLGENPLELPVPLFEGGARVEMRLKPAGSRVVKATGKRMSRVEWTTIGRLLTDIKSPYTLDDPESIKKLFGVTTTQEPAQTPEAPKPQEPEIPQV